MNAPYVICDSSFKHFKIKKKLQDRRVMQKPDGVRSHTLTSSLPDSASPRLTSVLRVIPARPMVT